MPTQVSDAIQWITVCCGGGGRSGLPPVRGWPAALSCYYPGGGSDYYYVLGAKVTTLNNPSEKDWAKAKNSSTAKAMKRTPSQSSHGKYDVAIAEWIRQWPGYLILTTDGRAIAIAAYDFWSRKSSQKATYLGDFTIRLLTDSRVAELHDLPAKVPPGTIRAYSEEDVFLLLEHPELKLINLAKISQAAQQVNALRAQLAELQEEKKRLEQRLAELSKQYAQAGFESQETAQARQEAERQLQETMQRELELQRQVQQLESQLAAAQADKKPWLWLALGGGILALFFLLRR